MGSPFFQGLVSTLSGHVKDFADKKRKEREQEYEEERSVFEGLLKSPDPQLREIGLAGLLEEKPKTGWLKKRVPSEAREKVRDYFSRINEVEQKVAPKEPDTSSVIPSSYSMNLPPPTVDGATVVDVPETTTLTGPPSMDNRDDLVHRPGLTPPPEMDPLSSLKGLKKKWERENSTAFGAKSPYEDTIAQAEALAASGASKEEIAEALKAGMTGKLDPLGTKFDYSRGIEEIRAKGRAELAKSNRLITISPEVAERLGIEPGEMDINVYKQMEQNYRTHETVEARKANAALMRTNYNFRFFPDSSGNLLRVDPRDPNATPEPVGGGALYSPPPALPQGTQETLGGMVNSMQQLERVAPLIEKIKTQGPIFGRVTLAEANKLGGMGVDQETMGLVIDLQRMVADESFARGGKNLTPTELETYTKYLPQMTDTVEAAITKANRAISYLKQAYGSRMSVMPERQAKQLPGSLDAAVEKSKKFSGGPPSPPGERKEINGVMYEKRDGPKGRGWYKVQ